MHKFKPGDPGVYDSGQLQDFISSLPTDEEQYHTIVLLNHLTGLGNFVNEYAAAIALHAHVVELHAHIDALEALSDKLTSNKKRHCLKLWDDMAGREAAMTVYHFAQTLTAIRSSIGRSVTLSESADHSKLREAFQRLQKDFPNYDLARNSVGHRGETANLLETAKRHGVNRGDHIQYLSGSMQNDAYVCTFKGKELRVELTEIRRHCLSEITSIVYAAFPPLEGKLPPMD